MASRTESRDLGDRTEVIIYSDGVEVSRAIKHKNLPQPGDALEKLLASYGVTKEWWVEVKEKFGLPPTCNCKSRQDWINKVSAAHPTIASVGVKLFNALTRK